MLVLNTQYRMVMARKTEAMDLGYFINDIIYQPLNTFIPNQKSIVLFGWHKMVIIVDKNHLEM